MGAGQRWGGLAAAADSGQGQLWEQPGTPRLLGVGGSEKADLGFHCILAMLSVSLVFIFCEVGALLPREVWG